MAPALSGIRFLGRVIAIVAGAGVVVYAITAFAGTSILWVVESPIHSTGEFVALPLPLRIAHTVAFVLGAATVAVIALLVADLAGRVRRGAGFIPVVSRTAWSLAIVLAAGSWLTHIAANVAGHAVLMYPDDATNLSFVRLDDLPVDWSIGIWSLVPDVPMLGLAVVLALLATIISSGERLQRDVKGLV